MASNTTLIERRRFLESAGTLAAVGLSGCSGGENEGDGSSGGGSDNGDDSPTNTPTKTSQKSEFPSEPITFIIPFGPGGGFDFYTRTVAKYINNKDYLPVQVKVKNVEGAGGIVGANKIYNAEPDGYTAGIWYIPGLARSQIVERKGVKYDMRKLTPYPSAAGKTPGIAVGSHTDVQNGSDLIQALKNDTLKLGAEGPMSAGRLVPVSLGRVGGAFDFQQILDNYVYFDGKGEWYTTMKRGEVDVMSGAYSSILKYAQTEDLRMALVMTTDDKPPETSPNASTLADVDVDNPKKIIAMSGGGDVYRVFVGPPDIPEERANTVRTAIRKALKDPDLQKEAKEADRPLNFAESEKAGATLTRYIETWAENKDLLNTLKEQS